MPILRCLVIPPTLGQHEQPEDVHEYRAAGEEGHGDFRIRPGGCNLRILKIVQDKASFFLVYRTVPLFERDHDHHWIVSLPVLLFFAGDGTPFDAVHYHPNAWERRAASIWCLELQRGWREGHGHEPWCPCSVKLRMLNASQVSAKLARRHGLSAHLATCPRLLQGHDWYSFRSALVDLNWLRQLIITRTLGQYEHPFQLRPTTEAAGVGHAHHLQAAC